MKRVSILTAVLFVGAACGGPAVQHYVRAAPPVIVGVEHGIPAGIELPIVLQTPIGVRVNGIGDRIGAELVRSIATPSGEVLVPAGSLVRGSITDIARPATSGNQVAIGVRWDELIVDGESIPMSSRVSKVGDRRPLASLLDSYGGGGMPLGVLLEAGDALALTGIGDADGTTAVISLGTGDTEPILQPGTAMAIEILGDLRIAESLRGR